MSRFVVYIAVSLDGYIADENGDVHWLEAFEKDDYGYEDFIDSVGSIILGRVTYEQILGFGTWPYGDTPTIVWSGSVVEDLPGRAVKWSENIEKTASWLREQAGDKDVWILGGAQTIQAFINAGMVDHLDLFFIPVFLGGGIRLFDSDPVKAQMLKLEQVQPYANGVVQLTYTMR